MSEFSAEVRWLQDGGAVVTVGSQAIAERLVRSARAAFSESPIPNVGLESQIVQPQPPEIGPAQRKVWIGGPEDLINAFLSRQLWLEFTT
jgi:hypothetical protein